MSTPKTMEQPHTPRPAPAADQQVSILLVDDEVAALETLAEIFEDMGFHAETASTSRQALAKIENRFYNVALLDIKLPDMEGTELLGHVRRLQPEMKCIMVTGDGSLEAAVKSVKEGAYWFLRKPIDVPYVEAVVRRALEQQSLELLAQGLVEHEGLQERLSLIADYLVRVTGVSRCAIWLLAQNAFEPQYVTGVNEEERRRLLGADIGLDELTPLLRRILDGGRATAVSDTSTEMLLPGPTLERWGVHSSLLLPLQSGGRIIGMAALSEPLQPREFSDDQVRQAQTIAYMAAVAIQQAQTIEEERDTLRILAESFLGKPPTRPEIEVAKRYEPAYQVPQIGGDYYDFLEIDADRVGVVIGDVCGKGRAAVSYIAMAKYMLRAYARENPTPQDVIRRLNSALYHEWSEECMFITMVYGIIDRRDGSFTYTNAAHPPPILYQPDGDEVLELMPTGGMIGAMEEMEFDQRVVQLQHGSVISMFTDGVTEARKGPEMLESIGVQEVVRARHADSVEAIAAAIHGRALEFADGILKDDVAIVVVRNV